MAENGDYKHMDVIRSNGKLYDKEEHTSVFTEKIECDVVWLFDWVDLPRPIQDYITSRAASITVSKIVGDQNLYQMMQQKEAYARALALEDECNQGQFTFFGHPQGGNYYNSYKPYRALQR